jgi:hypothetical protein
MPVRIPEVAGGPWPLPLQHQPRPSRRRYARAGPECQPQSGLQIEEGDGSVLALLSDDSLGFQAEAIPIEADGALQVVDAESDH